MLPLTRWPGNAIDGSWVIPILASAWDACLMPFSLPSSAIEHKAFDPPCCTTNPLSSGFLQIAFSTRDISSFMFLLSVLLRATNAYVIPELAKVWSKRKQFDNMTLVLKMDIRMHVHQKYPRLIKKYQDCIRIPFQLCPGTQNTTGSFSKYDVFTYKNSFVHKVWVI